MDDNATTSGRLEQDCKRYWETSSRLDLAISKLFGNIEGRTGKANPGWWEKAAASVLRHEIPDQWPQKTAAEAQNWHVGKQTLIDKYLILTSDGEKVETDVAVSSWPHDTPVVFLARLFPF